MNVIFFGFLVCSQGQLLQIYFEIKIVSSSNKHSEGIHQSRCDLCSMGSLLAIWSYYWWLWHLGSRLGGAPTTCLARQKHRRFYNALFGSDPSAKDCDMWNRVFDLQPKRFPSGKPGASSPDANEGSGVQVKRYSLHPPTRFPAGESARPLPCRLRLKHAFLSCTRL